jgi:hypothetical protein
MFLNLRKAYPEQMFTVAMLLPFRTWANRKYFDSVSENLRSKMIRASGLSDDPVTSTWKALRGIFYPRKTTFYKDMKSKSGDKAWALLEKSVGNLA